MSGHDLFCQPRRARHRAALALVFASVLVTGAAAGSFDASARKNISAEPTIPAGHEEGVTEAAARAMADGKSPMEAAERAVSRSGDRWAAVYSRGEYEEFEEALDGQYTGVGLSARQQRDGRIEVTEVQSGSPASDAGIQAGDHLRSVDGEDVVGMPVPEVVSLLRGDAEGADTGTRVRIGLQRGTRTWSEVLRRARLSTDPVTVHRLAGGAAVIRVAAFTKGSGDRVREVVAAVPRGDGIILDLRGNSGGLVAEAVTAASAFLDGGLVATYDVDGEQRSLHAAPGGDTGRAVVVLVDSGTMSAAELLTGALQDRGRAVVLGTRTFGKGSVQMPSSLPDGAVAELTVGHYRTPSGHSVDGHGITPDLQVDDDVLARAETVLSGLGGAS
ncbi:S41 family peptidase [Streptomyces sp. NPDC001020]